MRVQRIESVVKLLLLSASGRGALNNRSINIPGGPLLRFAKESSINSLKEVRKTPGHRKQLQKNTVELRGLHHQGTVIFVISNPCITYADVRDRWNPSLLSSRTIHDNVLDF